MKENTKKLLLTIVLILTLILNVKYVYAVDLNSDEDIVIDTDLQDIKSKEVITTKENIIREEVKETPSVQESKSESVTKAQDEAQDAKTEEVVKSEAPRAPTIKAANSTTLKEASTDATDGDTEDTKVNDVEVSKSEKCPTLRDCTIENNPKYKFFDNTDVWASEEGFKPVSIIVDPILIEGVDYIREYAFTPYRRDNEEDLTNWQTNVTGMKDAGFVWERIRGIGDYQGDDDQENTPDAVRHEILTAIYVYANNATKKEGQVDPQFSSTIWMHNNNPNNVIENLPDLLEITYEREEGENVGEYTITPVVKVKDGVSTETIITSGQMIIGDDTNGRVYYYPQPGKLTITEATGTINVHLVSYENGRYIELDKNGENVEYTHTFTGNVGTSYATDLENYPRQITGYEYIGTASTDFDGGADNELQLGVFERQGVYTKEGFDIFFVYKPLKLTLNFVTNGGTEVQAETHEYNDSISINSYPTNREYYYFDGWYKDEALTEKAEDFKITDNTTLYAKWSELDWDVSKSKEASELNEADETEITISLPSAEIKNTAEVVFVLDKSTYSDYPSTIENSLSLLSDLKESNASVKVAIVHFNRIGHPTEWFDVQTQYDEIVEALKVKYSGGSNMHAGLLAAQELLENSTDIADENKFVVLISDGSVYLHCKNGDYTVPYSRAYDRPGSRIKEDSPSYGGYWAESIYNPSNLPGNVKRPKVPDADKWEEYFADVKARNNESNGDQYDFRWLYYDGTKEEIEAGYIKTPSEPRTASNIDIAYLHCYETWKEFQSKYHTYAIGVKDNGAGEGNWDDAKAFMRYLNNNEEPSFDKIKKDMFLVSSGSKVVDYMGNDFDFVNDKDRISIKVGEETLTAEEISENKYGFGKKEDNTYRYTVEYVPGEEEHIEWNINENISNYSLTQLLFFEKLINKKEQMGEYTVLTNEEAVLYPVNSEGQSGKPEEFEKPQVTYTVVTNGTVIIHYIDKHGNTLHEDETMDGVVGTPYNTADKWNVTNPIIKAQKYRYLESTGKVTGNYTSERPINVTYIYEKIGDVIVHYVADDQEAELATITLDTGDAVNYTAEEKTFEHYSLTGTSENTHGVIGEDTIHVYYYYTRNTGKVVVHYVDTEDNVLADPVELSDKVGENYDTTDKIMPIDGYFYLNTKPGNVVKGKYTENQIDIYYVYMKGSHIGSEDGLKGDIFIRKQDENWDTENNWNTENKEVFSGLYENDKIDLGTSLEIAPIKQQLKDVVNEMYRLTTGSEPNEYALNYFKSRISLDKVNSVFTTELTIPKGIKLPKSSDSYKLLSFDGTSYEADYSNGMFQLIPTSISEDGTKVTITMILKDQEDIDDISELYTQFVNLEAKLDAEPDYLTFIIYGAEIESGVKNQTLTITGDVNGSLDADAISMNQNRHFRYDWGSTQNHTEPTWNDAKDAVITDSNNHNIQLTLEVLAKGKVITHYVDKDTRETIAKDEEKIYSTNDSYTTTKKEITDYTYVSDTGNTTGTFTEDDIEVTYYYVKNNGTVTVHYKDQKTGEDLPYTLEELTGRIGTPYETVKKEFPNTHYEYKEVVGPTTGNYSSEPVEVIYYYVWRQGTVEVHHVDAETKEELTEQPDVLTGDVDSDYTALAKDIEHYTLTSDSGNRIGTYTEEDIEVTFYYTRNTGKVIVKYVDEDGNLLDTVEKSGKVEVESYTTELKSFENYTLDEGQEVKTVTYTEDTQTITYTYSKNKGLVTIRYVAEDQVEDLDTIVIDTKKIGETYTSDSNEYDHYTLVEVPTNANGIVEATPIEVIYNYVRNTGKIIVHYVDADTNEELDTVEKSGKVETGSYTTEIKPFENYTPVEEYEPETVTFTEETQEITYKYTKNNGLVIVHYVDKDTNEDIETVRITDKKVDEAYTTEQKVFSDYHYVDKSDNTKGVVAATETNVYYYYEKDNGTVIVHHIGIKDETEKELDSESFPGKIGDNYTTSSKEFEHYTLDQTRIPEPGKFVSGSINVYYYYTWNKGQVVVHYVADDQDEELETVTLDPANVDSKYTTESKEFTNYRLTGDSGNRNGVVTEGQTDVYYYYTRLESDVTVHYVDADTNEELATEYGHGKVGETYTLINKDFENYTLVSRPEGETVTYTEEPIELTYTYKKNKGSLVVYYKDLFTGEEIEGIEPKEETNYIGEEYNATPIGIEGYEFIRTEGNNELVGTYTNEEPIVFTHYYQKVGKVIVHYYEVDSTTKVAEDVELETRPIGDTYITEAAKVEGYNLVETPTNAIGKYREALTEVIYYYEKLGNVITHFLNTNGEEVADSNTQSGVVGSDYTTEPAEVEGYELVGTPQNATGIYAKEDTHVYYIYGEPVEPTPVVNYGKVIVHYIDEEGNQLIDNIPLMGEVGTEYNAPEIPIAGYVLIDAVRINTQRALLRSILPEGKPNIGLFEDEPFQVNMIYRKVEDPKPETGKVIVLYTDTEGYELQKPIEIPGNVGEDYITSQPQIDGYKIYEVKGEKRGKIVAGTTYVEYVYEKVEEPSEPTTPDIEKGTVIAYYVDENGNSIADPMIIPGTYGTTYITYQKVIPGYTGTSIPENRIGKIEQELLELYYEYAKNEETPSEEPGSSCEGNCNCCNTCNTCNCNNGESQQPQIIININNENNSDNHSENHNDNSSDNHSENNNDNNVNNEVNNDTNVENNTDVNNENNNQDETNVNIENNPVNNNDNNTTVETGDTNVDVTTGDTNVENNTTTGDTNVTTGDVTTGDTTVTTGDQTVNTGDTNVTTGDTTIENNPTVENNTNVETGDTTVDTGDINNNVETGDTNVTTGDTTIENNPTNNVENNTDVDASSNNNNENTNNSESNPVIDLDNSSNSESNPTIENNPTINVEVNPTIDNTSNSESNPTVDNRSNSDSSSSSESNPNVENNTTVENNPTNTNESNPTNNVDVNPTIENNPTNNNEGSNTNDNNPTNNNEGSNTNTNENNNTDSCDDCNNPSEEPTDKPVDPEKPTEPKTGKVIVKYVDEDGYSISPSVTIPGEVNENYSTDQLRIEGYELSSVTGDKEGQIPEGTGYVTYTYKVKESPKGTVIVHYQDEKGNTLAKDETINGNIGDSYNTTEKYVEGYELTEIKKDEPVAMKLMLKRAVINEENASGTIKEGTTEITYIYKEVEESTEKDPETGKVIARYLDENENSITPSIPFEGKVNDDYYTDQLKIDGYELVSVEGERNGKIAPGTTYVIYRYKTLEQKEEPRECCTNIEVNCNSCPKEDPEKPDEPTDPTDKEDEKDPEEPQKGEVTARYIDTLGNKISGNITFRGTIGKSYETFAKLLEGYRLVRVEGVEKGTYTKDPAEVIYVYEKIVDEGEVQGETKTTPNEGTGSTHYELTPPSTNTDFNYLSLLIIPLLATFICKKKYN